MITEDYVSFEIAKLLKEKGFDEPSCFLYDINGKEDELYEPEINSQIQGFVKVTLQMAMKWLREVHHLNIVVTCYNDCTDYEEHGPDIEYFCVYQYKVVPFIGMSFFCDDAFGSYEEAVEAALKYCLTELL